MNAGKNRRFLDLQNLRRAGQLERIVDLEHPARSQVDPVDYARVS